MSIRKEEWRALERAATELGAELTNIDRGGKHYRCDLMFNGQTARVTVPVSPREKFWVTLKVADIRRTVRQMSAAGVA